MRHQMSVLIVILVAALSCVLPSTALAQNIDMGMGNSCIGTTPTNSKGKEIKVGSLTRKISNLQAQVGIQNGKVKAATQKKIKAAKTLKKLVNKCKKGTLATDGVGGIGALKDVREAFKKMAGSYSGSYFLQQGPPLGMVTINLTFNGSLATGTVSVDGPFIDTASGFSSLSFSVDLKNSPESAIFPGAATTNVGEKLDVKFYDASRFSSSSSSFMVERPNFLGTGLLKFQMYFRPGSSSYSVVLMEIKNNKVPPAHHGAVVTRQ